jgi:hypothetical protein
MNNTSIIFSVLAGVFCLTIIGAAITGYRHISARTAITVSQSR